MPERLSLSEVVSSCIWLILAPEPPV